MKNYFTPPGKQARRDVVVRPSLPRGNYQWVIVVDGVCGEIQNGSLDQLAEQCRAVEVSVTLLLSAEVVNLRTVALDDGEQRHYKKLIPFALEDDLAEAPETLHFAFTRPAEGLVGLAIIRASVLHEYCAQFAEHELILTAVVPELLLLPWSEAEQTWMIDDGYLIAHRGQFDGVKVPLNALPQLLELLGPGEDEGRASAQRVNLVCEQQAATVPLVLDGQEDRFVVHRQEVESLLAWLSTGLPNQSMNLLQGEFSAPLPWRKLRRQWAPVAVVLVAALALNFGGLIHRYQAQKHLSAELKDQQYSLVREVLPPGRIQSPERQLRALLNQAQSAVPTQFSALLALVGPHLQGDAGYAVRSINYDGRSSVLRLELRAANFQQIELFRKTMKENAVQAKLLNSSARGEGVLARLELSENQ